MDALPQFEMIRPGTLDELLAASAAHPQSRLQRSEEQERLAFSAFLDAGDISGAAGAWARLIGRRLRAGGECGGDEDRKDRAASNPHAHPRPAHVSGAYLTFDFT